MLSHFIPKRRSWEPHSRQQTSDRVHTSDSIWQGGVPRADGGLSPTVHCTNPFPGRAGNAGLGQVGLRQEVWTPYSTRARSAGAELTPTAEGRKAGSSKWPFPHEARLSNLCATVIRVWDWTPTPRPGTAAAGRGAPAGASSPGDTALLQPPCQALAFSRRVSRRIATIAQTPALTQKRNSVTCGCSAAGNSEAAARLRAAAPGAARVPGAAGRGSAHPHGEPGQAVSGCTEAEDGLRASQDLQVRRSDTETPER